MDDLAKEVEKCPHGVKRELYFRGEQLMAFTENCDVCRALWHKGEEVGRRILQITTFFIGKRVNVKRKRGK